MSGTGLALASKQSWQLTPTSLDEAMQYAKLIADSEMVPKDFKGKPGNVLIAIQMGDEVGLKPLQSLQSIAVINGRPSIWGDAIPGICQTSPFYEWHREYFDEDKQAAICIVKRKGSPEHTYTFSMKDVVAGGYDKKPGPWQSERRRMMQMRARRAFRDQFADALKGLGLAEDVLDIVTNTTEVTVATPKTSQIESLKDKLKPAEVIEGEILPGPDDTPDGPADPFLNEGQAKDIVFQCNKAKKDWKSILKNHGAAKFSELRESQLSAIYDWINEETA